MISWIPAFLIELSVLLVVSADVENPNSCNRRVNTQQNITQCFEGRVIVAADVDCDPSAMDRTFNISGALTGVIQQ